MPSVATKRKPSTRGRSKGGVRNSQLSARDRKQIDSLPQHAQHIYKKVHASAEKQYKNPEKRRGGKRQSVDEVTHKAAWAAVKKVYTKKGDRWVKKKT
jgi:cation transport regulator